MKRLMIPAIILVAAVIIWLIQSNYEEKRISGTTIENFLELDAADINRIIIVSQGDTLKFFNEDPIWLMENDPTPKRADMMVMNNVIGAAISLTVGNVISDNPEQQNLFSVDSSGGVLVGLYNNDELLNSVIIGKLTSDNAHTYIRIPGSDEVYTSAKVLTYTFNRERNQWLDKTIFVMRPELIQSVELKQQYSSTKLISSEDGWYVSKSPYTDQIQADSTKVLGFLRRLCFLRGNDFANVSDKGNINFEKPSLIIDIEIPEGTQRIEFSEIIDKDLGRYYCRRYDQQDTLVISMPIFTDINKDFDGFLPD
ncbi:MAG: DUF4340 domain-containing protein [candidate division Zixibacteria bacterium]|nr:DUF4340 domain-containing protein [candidate division Zixibacteria bacterium]